MTAAERTLDSLKPYPAYDSTRLPLVPLIPSGWEVRPLQSLCSVKARLGWKALKADEYVPDGYVFLATPNIKGASIDFENVNYISEFRYFESPEIALEEDDVLLAKDGSTLGIVNVVTHLPRPSTVNSSIAVLRTIKRLMRGDFLRYLLASHLMQTEIEKVKDGMGVPHLFQSDIKKFALLVPPVEDQDAITAFLDHETGRIDELVREQEQLLEDLAEKKHATCFHAVTQGIRASTQLTATDHPWVNLSPLTWRRWKVSRAFGALGSGTTPPTDMGDYYDGEIDWVNTGDLKDKPIYSVPKRVTSDAVRDYPTLRQYPAGTVVMAMYGATIGKLGLLTAPATVNQACCAFVEGGPVLNRFAFYWLLAMRPFIVALGYGGGQPNISQQTIRNMEIIAPDRAEQLEIAAYLDARLAQIDQLVLEVRANIEDMKLLRSTLITAATTGKIDVRDWRPA
ncbi:restriction endonuclease subunit S [Deinococcus gobiensis]|uniref:Restriction endonuclease S subunits n=1 Tax=Deinococcus gobiensis (strain DSM 21396 / JCM 16679 / CGMCC 1.7299 / I-0) TaxID=745776 RepID=H8H2Q1_DEIGI|nr:restriction endonuclease subunit S [Deinococcus gobiensis]AFD27798.1 Restriction endonuclease S subunits [Deinococcus gobiensis I-0]